MSDSVENVSLAVKAFSQPIENRGNRSLESLDQINLN